MIKDSLKYLPWIILLILSLIIVFPLFQKGYFPHDDDLQVMRIYEMRRCLLDYQIPCRWVPDMGFGNGFPLFNYYGVLPYYIGAPLSFFLGYIGAAKALFFIPLVLGGITMFFLGKELFGKIGGLVAAVLYLLAPYRSLDIYVRGAIAESFAITIIPIVFYFLLRLFKKSSFLNFVGLSISLAAFLISHNIMTLFFTPLFTLWFLFWLVIYKGKNIKVILLSFLLGLGLAAFFIIPAYLEKNLVQAETLTSGGLNFRAHFVTVNQIFLDRSFGYGDSNFGTSDTISFQVGWPHWWVVVTLFGLSIITLLFKNKLQKIFSFGWKEIFLAVSIFTLFFFTLFLTHNKSTFIWEKIELLQYSQFPWRLLSVAIFLSSLGGGLLVVFFKEKVRLTLAILIIVLTVFLNISFFKPEDYYHNLTDQEKLSGVLWRIQQQAGILDYLPKSAEEPKGPAPELPEVISGEAKARKFKVFSNKFYIDVNVAKETNLEIPIFDFPNWRVWVNGELFPHSHNNRLGRIRLDLAPGEYSIEGRLKNTPIRSIANSLTLISLGSIPILWVFHKRKYAIK